MAKYNAWKELRITLGFVGALALHSTWSLASDQTKRSDDVLYDGTLSSFREFIEAYNKSWPIPAELLTFEGAGGGQLRYAHWRAPDPDRRAGVVVFFSGRTEFIEKNIYAYQELLERNYDVWTLDWRGQGLSERLLPDEPEKGHIDRYKTYLADAELFVRDVVKLDELQGLRKILLAHSMGGAIGTLYLQHHPEQFDKAVFSAPLIRLPKDVDNRLIRAGNRAKIMLAPDACAGILTDCLWTSEFQDDVDVCTIDAGAANAALIDPDTTHRYSHDAKKVAEIECWISSNRPAVPSLGLGGPTSGWLRATYDATDQLNARKSRLETPLLIIGGGQDQTVSNVGQAEFCDVDNPQCCRIEFADAGHEILIESEPLKDRFFQEFDAFMRSEETPEAFCKAHQ